MSTHPQSAVYAYRHRAKVRRLEAGIAAVKPEFAVGRFMEMAAVVLALPDDKLAACPDFELTASRIAKRLEAMENRR